MTYFVPIRVIKNRITKCSPSILIQNYHLSCFISSFLYDLANKAGVFEKFISEIETSFSFKISCILLRQLIPLKKWWCYHQNLLFNFIVSYLHSFNPCISISEDGRYLSHSNIEQSESGNPWGTPHLRLKGSDRRTFFLVLDWILVYGTSIL